MNEMFNVKGTSNNFRDSNIVFQPKFDKLARIPLNTIDPFMDLVIKTSIKQMGRANVLHCVWMLEFML